MMSGPSPAGDGGGLMSDAKQPDDHDAEFARIMAVAVKTLATDFDLLDVAHQLTVSATRLFHASAAGVMLEDGMGQLRVLSASDEDTHLLEIFELQCQEGPCFECWKTQDVVMALDLVAVERWPSFTKQAEARGFRSAVAVPLRLRSHVVGALNIFWSDVATFSPQDLHAAEALADVAAVGLVQQRLAWESGGLAEQIQAALQSRVTIENAKGILAVKAQVSIAEAFGILKAAALDRNASIVSVAQQVVDRLLTWQDGALRPASLT